MTAIVVVAEGYTPFPRRVLFAMPDNGSPDLNKGNDTLHNSVSALLEVGEQYFLPEALELLRRTSAKARLSDDEILLLTVTAAQAMRGYHTGSGTQSANATLAVILRILDHEDVIRAEYNKLCFLLRAATAVGSTKV
ncbi:MAG TPA: hypothetical protein VMU69_26110 [Bradyrhizobium sp.]|nr:hypothetical protein [Bradyrhizobium sp.]